MRTIAAESWSVSVDVPELLHLALYVRDALGLPATSSDSVPPTTQVRRTGESRPLGNGGVQAIAEAEWKQWWSALVQDELTMRSELRSTEPTSPPMDEAPERLAAVVKRQAGSDPRGALLPGIVKELRDDALTWFSEKRRGRIQAARSQGRPPFMLGSDSTWLGSVAGEAAKRHGVGLGRVWASVEVLLVEGSWWSHPAPGVLFCSEAVSVDQELIARLLRDTFDSGLSVA